MLFAVYTLLTLTLTLTPVPNTCLGSMVRMERRDGQLVKTGAAWNKWAHVAFLFKLPSDSRVSRFSNGPLAPPYHYIHISCLWSDDMALNDKISRDPLSPSSASDAHKATKDEDATVEKGASSDATLSAASHRVTPTASATAAAAVAHPPIPSATVTTAARAKGQSTATRAPQPPNSASTDVSVGLSLAGVDRHELQ